MKHSKTVLFICSLMVFLLGCDEDFLEKTPPGEIPEEGFFNSAERAEQGVNAIYATLLETDLYSNTLSKLYDPPSGDAILSNTSGTNFNDFTYSATDNDLFNVYKRLYEGIYRANVAIAEIPEVEMDGALKARYIGEAKFLRAFYYWHLTSLWGDVPLFTQPFEVPSDALVAKSSREEIYAVMIQDLLDAAADGVLPASYSSGEVGRATQGAAQALLGKVYLYNENYEGAEEWLNKVIASGTYDLVNDYGDIVNINSENDIESIFEIQFVEIGQDDVGTLRVSYNNPQVNGGFGNTLPTQSIVDEFEASDSRLSRSIFIDGEIFAPDLTTPNQNLDTYQSIWSATGYNLKKGLFPVSYVNNGGINFPAIRYADVLLMYSEAANELGMLIEARNTLNLVRQRVEMPLLTAVDTGTMETMFDAIVHERRVELAFEFHRFNDLRRWGLAAQELGGIGYTERHRYYPLPQIEIDTNDKLEQRAGW
ncbi:MAG: hypothetical protein COC08_09385 [Maribacter sp.]|nr:MAG: hypothetical protein COC08_09385 [Maribacter sp.]